MKTKKLKVPKPPKAKAVVFPDASMDFATMSNANASLGPDGNQAVFDALNAIGQSVRDIRNTPRRTGETIFMPSREPGTIAECDAWIGARSAFASNAALRTATRNLSDAVHALQIALQR